MRDIDKPLYYTTSLYHAQLKHGIVQIMRARLFNLGEKKLFLSTSQLELPIISI
jgi:hypothetical protein